MNGNTSREAVLLEGFLKKKSPKSFLGRHPWQERYFALWGHQLCYYKKKEEVGDDDKCLGFLLVANMKGVEQPSANTKFFNVVLEGVDRQFELEAPSDVVSRQWVDAIRDVLKKHGQKPVSLATSGDANGQKFWKPNIHKKLIIRRAAISAESGIVDSEKAKDRSFTKTPEQEELLLRVIRQNMAFRIMDEDAQRDVVSLMWKASFRKNERIVQTGEAVRNFYVVVEGRVDFIESDNHDSEESKFSGSEPASPRRGSGTPASPSAHAQGSQPRLIEKNKRHKGEYFGELALLYDNNATYSATALEETVCFALDRFQYKKLVEAASEKRFALRMKFLKKTQVLQVIPDNYLNKISEALEERIYHPGERIVVQGDSSDSFFIVLSGTAYAETDGQRVKTYENPGEYFGERSLVSNEKRPATVVAETECVFLYLTRRDFVDLMGRIGDATGEDKSTQDEDGPPPPPPELDDPDLLPPPPPPPGPQDHSGEDDIPPAPERPKAVQKDPSTPTSESAKKQSSGKYTNIKLHRNNNDSTDSAEHFKFAAPEPEEKKMTVAERKLAQCPVQSLAELQFIGTLGRGTFGHVQLVVDKHHNTYALKAVNKAHVVRHNQIPHILNERAVMMELEHPFVVRLHRTMRDNNYLYFLLEPSLGGELFSVLRNRDRFDNDTAKFYAAIVVSVFQYMHSLDILYRDLKPENLLMDGDGYLRVTDFGFAKKTKDRTYTFCGTPDYLAPEIVASAGHHTGADWWTLGILIYEMLAGYTPFYDEAGPTSMYSKILAGKIYFPSFFPREAHELIQSLLQIKPTRRLGVLLGGADLIKRHSWFAGLDWNALYRRQIPAPIPVKIKDKFDLSNFDAYPEEENVDEDFVVDPANPDWDHVF